MDFQKKHVTLSHPRSKEFINFIPEKQIHYTRVETRSGQPGYPDQPGHILSRSSGSDPVHKISRSDPDSALDLIMESVPDKSNELSVLDDDYRSVSLIFFTIF